MASLLECENYKTDPAGFCIMPNNNTPIDSNEDAARGQGSVDYLLELGSHFALAERAGKMGYWRHEVGATDPHWSPGFFAILGLDPVKVRPSAHFLVQRIHPDDRAKMASEIAAAMSTGRPFYYRTRTWRMDGDERIFDTHGEVERNASGHISALLGVVREVSEEVHAERKLRESEAAYRHMTDEATDMITRHDRNGVSTFVSPAIRQMLGYEPHQVVGRKPSDFEHPDDAANVASALAEAMKTGETVTYEHRKRHRDGHYVWLESRVRFIANAESGDWEHAVSVTRDITKRKEFERELLEAREKAETASRTKTRFLANMSHELRTPLNAIIGFSDIMVREMFGPMGNARYSEYAKLVNESGGMLLDLINDLLDMSKIEAGKFELHIEHFMAADTIESSLRLLKGKASEKGIRLDTEIAPENLNVRADKRVFKQVLLNLVSNAIKFTNAGGHVLVRVFESGDSVTLSVKDDGIGISPEFLPKIAMPFEQASNDPARTHGGSGLGLALVKSLIALHGGEFRVQSRQGHGTDVTVTLPNECRTAKAPAA